MIRQAPILLTLALGLAASAARAQTWPSKPIRIIVAYAPGGAHDVYARILAQKLTERLAVQVFVENRAGAGGALGTGELAKAAPDGHTIGTGGIGQYTVIPAITPGLAWDPIRDFTHIAYLGGPPTALIVNPALGANSWTEFTALAKAPPRALPFGSPGPATHGHLIGEFVARQAGLKLEHVPYKGAGQAMTDLVAGHVKIGFMTMQSAIPHAKSNALAVLAVSSARRTPDLPDAPTFKELGVDLVSITWFVISGPAKLPAPIVDRLNAEIAAVWASPDMQARNDRDGVEYAPMTPQALTRMIGEEAKRWGVIAKSAGVVMQ